MVRGIERTSLFRDDRDRADFVARVAALAEAGAWTVLAWALLPNHAHLLLRTGSRPLPRNMRSLLTGYAGAFNRRHHRVGHLFQNRYKSILVEEEPYLRELVRYLHLNPLRAQVVPDLRRLDRYPWTGHSALLGSYTGDERILGQAGFVEALRRRLVRAGGARRRPVPLAALVARVCAATGAHPTALRQGRRHGPAARAREGIAYLALEVAGYTGPVVADVVGVHPPSVYKAAQRGQADRGRWERVLGRNE